MIIPLNKNQNYLDGNGPRHRHRHRVGTRVRLRHGVRARHVHLENFSSYLF